MGSKEIGSAAYMTDSQQPSGSAAHPVAHPVETARELGSEFAEGHSWRTPFRALGGTALTVAAVVIVIVALAFVAFVA